MTPITRNWSKNSKSTQNKKNIPLLRYIISCDDILGDEKAKEH